MSGDSQFRMFLLIGLSALQVIPALQEISVRTGYIYTVLFMLATM